MRVERAMASEETRGQAALDVSFLEDYRRVQDVLEGDLSAFDRLMTSHGPGIASIVRRVCHDPNEVEDAVQETFIRAYRSLSQYKGRSSFRTWLIRIALNVCRNRHRRPLWGRIHLVESYSDLGPIPTGDADIGEAMVRRVELERALDRLPDKYRLPVLLHYFEELTGAEIAAALGLNESTVWSRIYEGCRRLRKSLISNA